MNFTEIESLKLHGFTGFVSIKSLQEKGYRQIPALPGVYLIVCEAQFSPRFLEKGTGGYHKDKDPNVPLQELELNWVEGTLVVYIGKATSLRTRISQYMRFGLGKAVGHYGGRLIWQIENACDVLSVAWKPTPDQIPESVESELIQAFKRINNNKRPFANLIG